jgi:hypothetical protein
MPFFSARHHHHFELPRMWDILNTQDRNMLSSPASYFPLFDIANEAVEKQVCNMILVTAE